jgi:DNA-binding CsgD family transcriptional regulator
VEQGQAAVPAARSRLDSCVGRDEDLRAIEAFLLDAEVEVRCLTLAGDPGIGKTTTWEAGCERARALGFRVLSTRASQAENGLSFAGLADLVDGVTQADLITLPAPQLHALQVAIRAADPGDEVPEPFASAAGFLTLLSAAAAREPLVVAIDDVQWLDPATASALLYAVRRLARRATGRIRFLLCRRPGRRTALEDAFSGYGARQIRALGPLTLGAIQWVLSGHVAMPPRRVLRQIYEASQGNPLYAIELARLVSDRGYPEPGAELPIPDVAEDIFGPRVQSLAAPVRRALLATALSANIASRELARLVDPVAVEEAIASGLLAQERNRLRPAHPLLGAAARHLSSAAERRELHLALAVAVDDPALRARHQAQAVAGHDEVLARATAAAAQAATERGATMDAELLAAHALRLTPPGSPEYPGRLLALARCHIAAGDLARAGELLGPHLNGLPPGPERGRAHVMLGESASAMDEEAHLDQALAEAGDDAGLRVQVLSRKAMVLAVSMVERLSQAERAAAEALRIARDGGNEMRIRALTAQAWTRALRGLPIDDVRKSAPEPTAGTNGMQDAAVERAFGVRLACRGEVEQARVVFERLRGWSDDHGDPLGTLAVTLQLCELNLRVGDVREASLLIDELEQWSALAEMRTVGARLRALLAAVTGVTAEAARHAAVARDGADLPDYRWDWLEASRAAGIAALLDDDPEQAVSLLGAVWEHTAREHVTEPGAFPVAGDLVEALVLCGKEDRAREVAERLSLLAARQHHPWAGVTARRCSAMLHVTAGSPGEAADDFAAAAAGYARLGLRFEQARTLLLLGRHQRGLNRRAAARQSLTRARAEFDALGCSGWSARAAAELDRVSGRRAGDDTLTASERRVVELAAAGLPNKEIASRLFVSVYTVEAHLSHAYAKLGVRSRTQLAARVAAAK